jgi:putative flippase GtrA
LIRNTAGELVRFGIVGISSNLAGYFLYLLLTLVLDPKLAISLLYPAGALLGYLGHSGYSFSGGRRGRGVVARYAVAHGCGYALNLLLLFLLVERLSWPHQLVQAIAIVIVAGLLFAMFKFYVFAPTTPDMV